MADKPAAVDINHASLDELSKVPGMGVSLAEKVIAARPFEKVEDLVRVNGIGKKSLVPMLAYLAVEPARAGDAQHSVPPVGAELEPGSGSASKEAQARTDIPVAPEKLTPEIVTDDIKPDARLVENNRAQGATVVPMSTNLLVFPGALNHPGESVGNGDPNSSARALPGRSNAFTGPSGANRSGLNLESAGLMIGIGLLSLILGVVFSLGILRLVNGTLSYPNASQFNVIQVKVDSMGGQINSLQQDLDNLRTRIDGLQALSGRLGSVEEKTRAIEDEMKTTRDSITRLQEENKQLKDQVAQLQDKSVLFQRFLDGMRSLFAGLFPATPAQ
jgi:competence protein ComEA